MGLQARSPPDDEPLIFTALASGNFFLACAELGPIKSWLTAAGPVDFDPFESGGHRFSPGRSGTHTMGCIAAFTAPLWRRHKRRTG